MIACHKVDEIKRLLAEGELSQRKIAKELGVSRGTVGAIASGKRRDAGERKRMPPELPPPEGPPRRCRKCGGLVQMPCLACRVRSLAEDRRGPRAAGGAGFGSEGSHRPALGAAPTW